MIFVQRVILLMVTVFFFASCQKPELPIGYDEFVGTWKWTGYSMQSSTIPVPADTLPAIYDFEIEFGSNGRVKIKKEGCLPRKGMLTSASVQGSGPSQVVLFVYGNVFKTYNYNTGNASAGFTLDEESGILLSSNLGIVEGNSDGVSTLVYFTRQ